MPGFGADLSLWIAVVSSDGQGEHAVEPIRIDLPTTFRSDGGGGDGQVTTVDFSLPNGRAIALQLVYHPLCDVEHPFEAAGLAVRVWPDQLGTLSPAEAMIGKSPRGVPPLWMLPSRRGRVTVLKAATPPSRSTSIRGGPAGAGGPVG